MYEAKILADSINPVGDRLTTFEVTYPRIIHQEMLTHRMLSRNSASSRAIPHDKLRQKIISDPFVPIYWGKNQSGMQALEELSEIEAISAESVWLSARGAMLQYAEALAKIGVHKQIVNRLIEPWMWITVIYSATEWDNFFHLRRPKLVEPVSGKQFDPNFPAQPEIQKIAVMMRNCLAESKPKKLNLGEWHLPLTYPDTHDAGLPLEKLIQLSAARCARVSYLTHSGQRDTEADLTLHDRLVSNAHWSPFEHQAQALETSERHGNFIGWMQNRKFYPIENAGRG